MKDLSIPRPLPNPKGAGFTDEMITDLRDYFLVPPNVAVFAGQAGWIGQTGVGPISTGTMGKQWRDNDAIDTIAGSPTAGGPKAGWERYYVVLINGTVDVTDQRPSEGLAHLTFQIIGMTAANYIKQTPGYKLIPRLAIMKLDSVQASEVNFDLPPLVPIPLCILAEDETGGIEFDGKRLLSFWPQTKVLRFKPSGGVEAIDIFRVPAGAPVPLPTGVAAAQGAGGEIIPRASSQVAQAPASHAVASRTPTGLTGLEARDSTAGPPVPRPGELTPSGAWERHEGMLQNTMTGEAFMILLVGAEESYTPSGWFFHRVGQMLPDGSGPMDTSFGVARISPWAFATDETADRLVKLFRMLAPDLSVTIHLGDRNERFPTNVEQLFVRFIGEGGQIEDRNAGLIASRLARNGESQLESLLKEELGTVRAGLESKLRLLNA